MALILALVGWASWKPRLEPATPNRDHDSADVLSRMLRPGERLGMLIPVYFYPAENDPLWDRLLESGGNGVPIKVVINPGIEKSHRADMNYVRIATKAREKQIDVLGYLSCDRGQKDLEQVKKELREWHDLYPNLLQGFFFDNQSTEKAMVSYFTEAFAFTRSLSASYQIVSCPGSTPCDEAYISEAKADILCISNSNRPDAPRADKWMVKYEPGRFAALTYGVDDPSLIPNAVTRSVANHVTWVYVTDNRGFPDRGYQSLPDYLRDEVLLLRNVNRKLEAPRESSPRRP